MLCIYINLSSSPPRFGSEFTENFEVKSSFVSLGLRTREIWFHRPSLSFLFPTFLSSVYFLWFVLLSFILPTFLCVFHFILSCFLSSVLSTFLCVFHFLYAVTVFDVIHLPLCSCLLSSVLSTFLVFTTFRFPLRLNFSLSVHSPLYCLLFYVCFHFAQSGLTLLCVLRLLVSSTLVCNIHFLLCCPPAFLWFMYCPPMLKGIY